MFAKARLFLNADKSKLVHECSEEAAFLYAIPGDEIPDSAAEMFGLVDGDLPKPEPEREPKPENKGKKAGADKSVKGDGDKSAAGDDAGAAGASDAGLD